MRKSTGTAGDRGQLTAFQCMDQGRTWASLQKKHNEVKKSHATVSLSTHLFEKKRCFQVMVDLSPTRHLRKVLDQ
jgi:hypothetical protein